MSYSTRKPAYLAISDSLREKIHSGVLRPGDRYPTERELVEEFNVARMTVRQALEVLEEEGLIDRRRGRGGGTFVKQLPPTVRLGNMDSFDVQLGCKGVDSCITVLSLERGRVAHNIAAQLEIPSTQKVWLLTRMRCSDNKPVSMGTNYLPAATYPDLQKSDLTAPLFPHGVDKRESVAAVLPTEEQQATLGVGPYHPLLCIKRQVRDAQGQVVAYVEEFVCTSTLNVEVQVSNTGHLDA